MTETAADIEFDYMDENVLMTVITHQLKPQSFFEQEFPEAVPTGELMQLVMTSPKSAGKFVISEVSDETESFLGKNQSFYELTDFELIQPSLSFEDIFRLFDSTSNIKTFVDEIEATSAADYWMVYRCEMDDDNSTLTFVPVGRFNREEFYAAECEIGEPLICAIL